MSRQQPIPSDNSTAKCLQSDPVVRPNQDTQDPKRAFAADNPLSDPSPEIELSRSDELAALRAFFELLSQWDESLKGEIEHDYESVDEGGESRSQR